MNLGATLKIQNVIDEILEKILGENTRSQVVLNESFEKYSCFKKKLKTKMT